VSPVVSSNIFLVFGEDEFLVEQALARLIRDIAAAIGFEPQVETIDCSETAVEDFVAQILSPSLFAEQRISVVKHLVLTGRSRLTSEIETLISEELPQGQFLVLMPRKIDKRLKIFKLLEQKGKVLELPSLGHEGLVEWIIDRFKELGKTVGRDAAEMILDLKGEEDTRALNSEVEKLAIYVGKRPKVTVSDVEAIVGKTKTEHVFELIRQVTLKDITAALGTLDGLLKVGESPLGIILLLSREVKALIQVRLFLKDTGLSLRRDPGYNEFVRTMLPKFRDWIANNRVPERFTFTRYKPYAIYRRFVEALGFELSRLVDLLDALVDINAALVSTSIDPRILIENFLFSVGGCEKKTS